MRTLILPCAGKSTRYPNMRPKWMLTHPTGELMLKKAIEAIDLNLFDNVYIVIVKHHDSEYDASLILRQVFASSKIHIHVLDDFTSCVGETVYRTIKDNNIEGEIVIKDADNYVKADYSRHGNFVVGLNIENKDISRLSAKSFIKINESNIITDVIEKQVKSNIISLGVYGFESTALFNEAYIKLKDSDFAGTVSKEIYISHVIAYCIGMEKACFSYYEAEEFEDWGTMDDWLKVQRYHAAYFIDIDGVLIKNSGRYGKINWDNNEEMLLDNIKTVKSLATQGSQVFLITSRPEEYRPKLEALMKKHQVPYHNMIMGCHHAPRVIINDFAPTNPYPSCEAVNIQRDGKLEDYMLKFKK